MCEAIEAIDGLGFIFCRLTELLGDILPVLIALGVVYFVWGVVQYVIGDSDEAKTKGKDKIVYGIIGFVIILSLWGLVYIISDTFFLEAGAPTDEYLQGLLPGRGN